MALLKEKIELDVQLAELRAQQALNTFPTPLRWTLIFCLVAIIPAYFIAKGVSYRAWTKTYSQYLISARPSFTNPKTPLLSDITMTTTGNGNYGASIKVTNDNVDLSAPKANYQFMFYDASGSQLYQESGTTFLLPNDQKYLVVPRFSSDKPVKSANFIWVGGLNWEKRLSIPKVDIQTSVPDTYNQFLPPAFVAEGNYYNNSPYQLGTVRLTFLILDQGGKLIGASRRDDFTVAPFERRSYKQLWPNVYGDPSYTVKVYAETNTLDGQNLTLPAAPITPASNLSRPVKQNN